MISWSRRALHEFVAVHKLLNRRDWERNSTVHTVLQDEGAKLPHPPSKKGDIFPVRSIVKPVLQRTAVEVWQILELKDLMPFALVFVVQLLFVLSHNFFGSKSFIPPYSVHDNFSITASLFHSINLTIFCYCILLLKSIHFSTLLQAEITQVSLQFLAHDCSFISSTFLRLAEIRQFAVQDRTNCNKIKFNNCSFFAF